LPQDRQLGLGRPTAALILDHTGDHDWGVSVLGATASFRGGENRVGSYRAPAASLYGHLGYLLGPVVPAIGVSVTGFAGRDRDRGLDQASPLASAAASASLEWSNDWLAVLIGASLPYDYTGGEGRFGPAHGPGAWLIALGASLAPF